MKACRKKGIPHRGYYFKKIISTFLIALLVSANGCSAYGTTTQKGSSTQGQGQSQGQIAGLNPEQLAGSAAAAGKVVPTVVGITAVKLSKSLAAETKRVQGVGSGIIVDPAGYILTNNHVAGGNPESLTISLYDGREVKGTTVWADPVLDLAIVKVSAGQLTAATLGNSQNLRIGEPALAIGNPLGLTFQRTVTSGVISAVNRTIEVEQGNFMEGLIQTDASINPGNSGGPLININGEVVGINTIKVTTAEGMGFAVPINVAKPVIQKVSKDGRYATPTMAIQGLDKELSNFYDFVLDKGVYVFKCTDGGSAHKAGIRKGDTILAIDGKDINTAAELREAVFAAGVGKVVNVRYRDQNGVEKNVQVTLDGM